MLDHIGGLGREWDELVAAQPLPSPFLRSWWVDHTASGELKVLACFDRDVLVGGAAFELDRVGVGPARLERVRCVGQGALAPDHLDLIAAPDHHLGVARAVLAWLRRPGARVIDLDGLAATGTLARVVGSSTVSRIAAPYADLAGGAEPYLAARPGKVRSTIARTTKRFDRQGVVLWTSSATDVESGLDDLARLHDERWSTESEFLLGWDRLRSAATAGAATGDVTLHALRDAQGEAIAIELDLSVGTRVAFYQAGRRTEREWRGCGSVLRARIIESIDRAGATEYDLLRGDEPYKAEWATARRELCRCWLGVGPLGRAAVRAALLRRQVQERRAAINP